MHGSNREVAMTIAALYETYEQQLHRYAHRLARDPDLAKDLVQETFVRTLGHRELLAQLNPHQQRRWLFRTLERLFLDAQAARQRTAAMTERLAGEMPAAALPVDQVATWSPFDLVPEMYREIVEKRYVLGMTSREIAAAEGIPAATVRSRLHLAMKALRAHKHRLWD